MENPVRTCCAWLSSLRSQPRLLDNEVLWRSIVCVIAIPYHEVGIFRPRHFSQFFTRHLRFFFFSEDKIFGIQTTRMSGSWIPYLQQNRKILRQFVTTSTSGDHRGWWTRWSDLTLCLESSRGSWGASSQMVQTCKDMQPFFFVHSFLFKAT